MALAITDSGQQKRCKRNAGGFSLEARLNKREKSREATKQLWRAILNYKRKMLRYWLTMCVVGIIIQGKSGNVGP
jgi:hypothetical protein